VPLKSFPATRQILFHQLLAAARKTWLLEALRNTLGTVDPKILKPQLDKYVPVDVQKILASVGIRDEYIFPAPIVLETRPSLIGYYRLLIGVSQKKFYEGGSGMGLFKSMEARNTMTTRQQADLPDFCKAMAPGLADLVRQISPAVSQKDLEELPLLTLGAQFYGGNNNTIGAKAKDDVFAAITEIVKPAIKTASANKLVIVNASKREVSIVLASDPDLRIMEQVGSGVHKKVAIEIKGGTDKSNAHNRAGEAEKSHQKAKGDGYPEFWTIIATKGVDVKKLQKESPTTNHWFDTAQILGRSGPDWDEFKKRFAALVGIPVPK